MKPTGFLIYPFSRNADNLFAERYSQLTMTVSAEQSEPLIYHSFQTFLFYVEFNEYVCRSVVELLNIKFGLVCLTSERVYTFPYSI